MDKQSTLPLLFGHNFFTFFKFFGGIFTPAPTPTFGPKGAKSGGKLGKIPAALGFYVFLPLKTPKTSLRLGFCLSLQCFCGFSLLGVYGAQ